MSEGKDSIRDDGVGSGLSIWMDDGVISLNGRLRGEETFGGESCEFLWDTLSLRCLYDAKWRCQAESRIYRPSTQKQSLGEDLNLEATIWKN